MLRAVFCREPSLQLLKNTYGGWYLPPSSVENVGFQFLPLRHLQAKGTGINVLTFFGLV
jgi:hypothetical protein